MYTLVFDTTGNGVNLALYKGNVRVAGFEKVEEFGQAEDLATGTARVLEEAGIGFDEVGLLGVCTGPGSFTGVRSGLAFARGLAFCRPDMAITGVSAFDVYANMLASQDRAFYNAVVIETKREDFYFQLFDENLVKLSEPLALTREEITRRVKSRQTSFIGDGVERLLSVSLGLQIKQVEISSMTDTDALFRTVYQKYMQKSLDFPKPLYIRGVDACVK